ncbi:MAG TPA: hypothetical protein VK955_01855 [Xanthobacteraceae bacterium]|nr:hypothetical protein [Xanthobacteraceae bacterium]
MQSTDAELLSYVIGAGALFAAACAAIGFILVRQRAMAKAMRLLEMRTEELSDRTWELREA